MAYIKNHKCKPSSQKPKLRSYRYYKPSKRAINIFSKQFPEYSKIAALMTDYKMRFIAREMQVPIKLVSLIKKELYEIEKQL